MNKWLEIALREDVVKRSSKVSLIVGTLLTVINQLDLILTQGISVVVAFKVLLTYCVPYCVATYSSVGAILAQDSK